MKAATAIAIVASCLALIFGGTAIWLKLRLVEAETKLSDAKFNLSISESKLSDANAKLKDTQSDLDQANASLQRTQTEAQKIKEEADLPELHVRLAWASADSAGMRSYAILTNDNDTATSINFSVKRKDGTTRTMDAFVMAPHQDKFLQIPDWTFLSGDVLEGTVAGHKSGYWTVP